MDDKLVLFNGPIIDAVYNGKKENWIKRWLKMRSFKKKLSKLSPDFTFLYAIAEFVRSLEIIYNYKNNEQCKIYSVNSKLKDSSGTNLFINVNDGYIEYQLSYPNIIKVQMHRTTGNKLLSKWEFADGECELVNKETEMLMERIIEATMDAFIDLFRDYYLFKVYEDDVQINY